MSGMEGLATSLWVMVGVVVVGLWVWVSWEA